MNRDNERQSAIILSVIGIIPVVWLALLIAPSVKGGLPEILPSLLTAFNEPFHIELCEDSLKTVLVLLLCYAMGIGIYFSTQKNYRRREEHGSAKWGNARAVNKKYRQSPASANKLMTQNVCIGLNAKKHRRNLNTLVCGGSGAGKTRFYCKPNLMQCNTSFVILDPKGEILRDTGKLLESKGYEVRVLDLISMEKSHCYNPFVYLQNDNDVQKLVTNLFKSTTPKGSQSQDPFWDTSASMLLLALVFYLHDGDEFPGYENIRLSFSQLETIIRNKRSGWLDALRNQKAVYLITDTSNGKMYVGSATAQYGMLLQRWTNYIDNGHGGNVELKHIVDTKGFDYIKANFQYSVLENYNARMDDNYILSREKWWKDTLCTRQFGYNKN